MCAFTVQYLEQKLIYFNPDALKMTRFNDVSLNMVSMWTWCVNCVDLLVLT